MPSPWAYAGQFDETLAIFDKARTDGSINAQKRYWEAKFLHGDLAMAIAVAKEALALDPEASVFVDRIQKPKALECPSAPSPPSATRYLGARLVALLRK